MVAVLDVVSVLATIALIVMLLGPMPDIRAILRARATGVTPLVPFVAMFTNSWIWTAYGYLDHTIFPVAICNFMGVLLGGFYTIVFYWFTTEKAYAHKVLCSFGGFVCLLSVYGFLGGFGVTGQSREGVKNVFGYLGVITNTIFFASSFENIGQVFKYRSGVFIPILLVLPGAVNSALWVIYALLDSDWFIFVPNSLAVVIACVQIGLYFAFHPSTHPYDPMAVAMEEGKELEVTTSVAGGAVSSPSFVALQSPHAPVGDRA